MNFDLWFVQWVQTFRNPFLDQLFILITELGDETVFLVIAAILYWIVDKKFAYRLMMFFLYSASLNALLKLTFQRPRPFNEGGVESVSDPSSGNSFPSGHAMNATTTALVVKEKRKPNQGWVEPVLWTLVALVMFSRVYLGQHYLTDVLAGFIFSIAFYHGVLWLQKRLRLNPNWVFFGSFPFLILAMIVLHDEVLFVTSAGIIGINIGVLIEQRYIRFQERDVWWNQMFKFVIGISVALGLRYGLKALLPYSPFADIDPNTMDLWLDFFRYTIICFWMICGAPYVFKWLPKVKDFNKK